MGSKKTKKNPTKNRIAVYVRNQRYGPSDYYRVVQYLDELKENVVIHDALPDSLFKKNLNLRPSVYKKAFQAILFVIICVRRFFQLIEDTINHTDIIVIQREIFPRYIPLIAVGMMRIVVKDRKIIWDFDDDIFEGEITSSERKLLEISSNTIVVTSNYLKNKLRQEVRDKVVVLPTSDALANADEVNRLIENREKDYDEVIRIVWTGTASNLRNLDLVFDVFEMVGSELVENGKRLELYVVCNVSYNRSPLNFSVVNVVWTREKAKDIIRDSHIGIMPLADVDYSKGKGGFKLIQYISCGLPVIASAVGFNREIIKTEEDGFCCESIDDWLRALRDLTLDVVSWRKHSISSHVNYMNFFCKDVNQGMWLEVLSK